MDRLITIIVVGIFIIFAKIIIREMDNNKAKNIENFKKRLNIRDRYFYEYLLTNNKNLTIEDYNKIKALYNEVNKVGSLDKYIQLYSIQYSKDNLTNDQIAHLGIEIAGVKMFYNRAVEACNYANLKMREEFDSILD